MSPQPTFYRIPKDSNLRWITLFYNMPRELVEKRPEFLNMPRKIREVFKSEKWMSLINTDVFLELIWDCYAWTGWQFFQVPDPKGGYMDIPGTWGHYSGDFPMWHYAYMLPALILQQLEQLPGQDIQSLLLRPKEFEVAWVSYEVFYSVIGRLTQSIVETMKWQPIFDEIWNNRAHEDYNGSNSKQRDFLRSWNHTRKPEAETTVEKVADSGMTVGKKVSYDLTDKSEPMEEQVAQKDYIARFEDTLSERDKKILQLRMGEPFYGGDRKADRILQCWCCQQTNTADCDPIREIPGGAGRRIKKFQKSFVSWKHLALLMPYTMKASENRGRNPFRGGQTWPSFFVPIYILRRNPNENPTEQHYCHGAHPPGQWRSASPDEGHP